MFLDSDYDKGLGKTTEDYQFRVKTSSPLEVVDHVQ